MLFLVKVIVQNAFVSGSKQIKCMLLIRVENIYFETAVKFLKNETFSCSFETVLVKIPLKHLKCAIVFYLVSWSII